MRRSHFQVSAWKAALEKDPPEHAPTNFGWEKDKDSRSLLPVTTSEGVALAPMDVLKRNQVRLCNGPAMRNCQVHVELLKCQAPFSVGVMEWKSAATYGQKRLALPKKTWTVTVMTSTCVMTELF